MTGFEFFLLGLVLGLLASGFFFYSRLRTQRKEAAVLQKDSQELEAHCARLDERNQHIPRLEAEQKEWQQQRLSLEKQAEKLRTELAAERERASLQPKLLEQAQAEFKNLAARIFDEKGPQLQRDSKATLDQLLAPFRQSLDGFKTRAEQIHYEGTQQQSALRTELEQLKTLNQQMSSEARQLTTALQGQPKKQGLWGEMILEKVLEKSGLRPGQDYRREVSFATTETRKRPDVVVYLPQGKHLVIDAKVSLNAYTRYSNSTDPQERQQFLGEHIQALKNHINDLSSRDYGHLPGLNSPEVVFLFIPVESAYAEAVREDEHLMMNSLQKSILLTTPTTLLASLNIVRQLWRFEEQNRHTAELGKMAGDLHKKFEDFKKSLDKIGKSLDQAQDAFNTASRQLSEGRGNLLTRSQRLAEYAGKPVSPATETDSPPLLPPPEQEQSSSVNHP